MERFSFTQCACVLFDHAPALEVVERALKDWTIVGEPNQGEGDDGWAVCGPGFVAELRGGGFAVIDVLDRAWPDDAATAESVPAIGSAWHAGAFGPAATPRALARAMDQSWAWPEGAQTASGHGGVVRLRTGTASSEEAPVEGDAQSDPLYELTSLTELARPLLRLPGALAFFVPAGEALRSRAQVEAALDRKVGFGPPPIELWSNLRSVALPGEGSVSWLLMDVVGMGQFGQPDPEALFAEGQEQPDAVETLLRNVCLHLTSARLIPAGATADDGSGRRWRATAASGVVAPSRPVLRWLPEQSVRPTEAELASAAAVTAGTGSG
ncbi:MAG TPA: hypothetical protein VE964_05955 [Myxococcales bacterium]|nr:hypothetical protein [Myxococcales bacterium]